MHSDSGYCVTFNQASQGKNPFEYYNDQSYAKMIAILKNECKSSKLQIGIFGGVPEVSVICDDYKTAYDFGFLHNQNSIFDNRIMSKTGDDDKATIRLKKNGKGYIKYYNNV